jgi:SLT domain-containing protein
MGARREYTAVFAIGAKLLGSFKGAMLAAQSRLKAVEQTAAAAGKSILKFGSMFSTLFAGLAAFGLGAIFKKIFEGADQAAEDAENSTRRLTASLMQQKNMRSQGLAAVQKEIGELYKHNEVLAERGVISKQLLNNATTQLAVQRLGPREIAESVGPLADVLVAAKGVRATQEDMTTLSRGFGAAVQKGMTKPLSQFGIVFSDEEQKAFKKMSKLDRYKVLTQRIKLLAGENAKALATPSGRIQKLQNDIVDMSERIGEAAKPARAELADVWRSILPEVEPMLLDLQKLGLNAMTRIARFIKSVGVPAFKTLSAWWKGEGVKAFTDMWSKIGKAFANMLGLVSTSKKSFAELVQDKLSVFLKKLGELFKWIGDNASWLVPTLTRLAFAFAAVAAVSFIYGKIQILGIAAAVSAMGYVASKFQYTQDLLEKKPITVDTEQFTKHLYLANQSWSEFTINLANGIALIQADWDKGVLQMQLAWTRLTQGLGLEFRTAAADLQTFWNGWKAAWATVVNFFVDEWHRFLDAINIFKPPAWLTGFLSAIPGMGLAAGVAGAAGAAGAGGGGGAGGPGGALSGAAGAANAAGAGIPGLAAAAGAAGAAAGGPTPVTVASYGGAAEPGQTIGAYNNRLGLGDVAISPNLIPILGPPGPSNYVMLDGQRYHVADTSMYSPGRPTSNMVEIWGYGNQIKRSGNVAKAYQFGGIASRLTHALLGEHGPEAVIPLSGGARARGLLDIAKRALGMPGASSTTAAKGNVAKAYQFGGIASRLTHAILGEHGPEAVIPLSGGARARGLLGVANRALGISSASTTTSVNFAPNITINGAASEREQASLDARLRDLARDFVNDFKRAQSHERRLSYEGGYG